MNIFIEKVVETTNKRKRSKKQKNKKEQDGVNSNQLENKLKWAIDEVR